MALKIFSLDVVQKVRQHICTQLVLPPSEQEPPGQEMGVSANTIALDSLDALGELFRVGGFADDNLPAPNNQGRWFVSTIDPGAAINKLPGLSLKPGVRLITYLQRRSAGGMGVTWALPDLMSTTAQLEAALESAGNGSIPPHPKGALSHVMDGLTGERITPSFIAASLLLREWKELGRTGPNRRWSHHRLIAQVPSHQNWQWRTQIPTNLSPKVKIQPDQSVLVEFYSFRMAQPVSVFRHRDHYLAKTYRPRTQDQAIALLEEPSLNGTRNIR